MFEQEEKDLQKRVEAKDGEIMDADSYIEAINSMKENSVPKDDFLKLKEENRKLLNSLAKGEYIHQEVPMNKPDTQALRKELFDREADFSNLDYISKALELRNAVLEESGVDVFVPSGAKYVPTEEDYRAAERVADVFQQCIDYANGDSQVFTNELMRRTVDTSVSMPKKIRK